MKNSTSPERYGLWTVATWIWFGLLVALIFSTAGDYGDSWDEKIRANAGEKKLAYYEALLSGDFDQAMEEVPKGDNYPGFHDLNLAILRRISPLSDYLTGNLFAALLGVAAILGTVRLARRMSGPAGGFWAGVLLTLLPAFYGHLYINPKDIPFAFGYIWSLNFIYEWITADKRPQWRVVILCGIAVGITMACRIGGLVLLCYLGLFIGIRWVVDILSSTSNNPKAAILDLLRVQLPRYLAVVCIAFPILLLYWPAGQLKPFSGTSQTLENVTRFNWEMPVFFEGAFFSAPDLPAYYILKMILLKVPVITLALFAVSLFFIIRETRKKEDDQDSFPTRLIGPVFILFAIVFPVFYVIFKDSILYNGLRHLLFVLPPMCVLSAFGLIRLYDQLKRDRPNLLAPLGLAFAFTLVLPVVAMIRLHPYQYVYYNELAGGTARASENYELDYWGTVYKELAEDFYAFLVRTRPSFSKPEVVVNMEHVTWLFSPFLPDESRLPIRVVRSRPDLDDYYAASTTWIADQFYFGQTVAEVDRMGVRLGVVKDRRGLTGKERAMGYQADDP